jgi:hypothetical protein
MATMINTGALLRTRRHDAHARVTFVELFFDLVFVFAITQLAHTLLDHLTLAGLVQTTLLLMAVWWVWIYTAWVTNWLDPDRSPVRLLLFALMLGGLVLSTSLPEAFQAKGLVTLHRRDVTSPCELTHGAESTRSGKCHVWTAPCWQGLSARRRSGRSSHVFGLLMRLA